MHLCNRSISTSRWSQPDRSHSSPRGSTTLPTATVRGVIVARIKRLEQGLAEEVKPVGAGVPELRISVGAGWVGAGWRMYFRQPEASIIVLLAGGSKRTWKSDIKRAKALAALPD